MHPRSSLGASGSKSTARETMPSRLEMRMYCSSALRHHRRIDRDASRSIVDGPELLRDRAGILLTDTFHLFALRRQDHDRRDLANAKSIRRVDTFAELHVVALTDVPIERADDSRINERLFLELDARRAPHRVEHEKYRLVRLRCARKDRCERQCVVPRRRIRSFGRRGRHGRRGSIGCIWCALRESSGDTCLLVRSRGAARARRGVPARR